MVRILALVALFLILSVSMFGQTVAPAPSLMNFQGRLTRPDGTPVTDGNYSLRFSLWTALTGGTEKWNQTVNPVTVRKGTFAVLLNVASPADLFNTNLWLEIKIGTAAPLTPRQQLVSVAFALKANTVPDNAITSAKIADGTITSADIANGTIAAADLASGVLDFWKLTGNAGTTSSHFLGTTDNKPLVIKANSRRVLQIEDKTDAGNTYHAVNVLGGAAINRIETGVVGATIAGGGQDNNTGTDNPNEIWGNFGTIGGGSANFIDAFTYGTIAGGSGNNLQGNYAAISGGSGNNVQSDYTAIGGGSGNFIFGAFSTIGGGSSNSVQGNYATVGGGASNNPQSDFVTIGGGSQNSAFTLHSVIGGGEQNIINGSAEHGVISGGKQNSASGWYSTIGGGFLNTTMDIATTVGGGWHNSATELYATVGGGTQNTNSAQAATIAGGRENTNDGWYSTIGGGYQNSISGGQYTNFATIGGGSRNGAYGSFATIPGGYYNYAGGEASFAAGYRAVANHNGSFVWADYQNTDFSSSAVNQFAIRSSGGMVLETGQNAYLYTSATSGEKNRYFMLLNSYQTPSASGLKAGGILCADSFAYANPGKNNMVVKGTLGVGYPDPAPYTFAVNGSIYALNGYSSSDARYKKDIATLDNALDKIQNLRGVSFDWNKDAWKEQHFPDGRQIGFIAQEVEKVLPELVSTDAKGYKAVAYANVVPVLVEAMKTLKKDNNVLRGENAAMRAQMSELLRAVQELKADVQAMRK